MIIPMQNINPAQIMILADFLTQMSVIQEVIPVLSKLITILVLMTWLWMKIKRILRVQKTPMLELNIKITQKKVLLFKIQAIQNRTIWVKVVLLLWGSQMKHILKCQILLERL